MPPQLIGVINLTADKPGTTLKHATTIDEARRIADDYRDAGFSAVDLGAQSSHYAAPIMGTSQELGLLVPIIEALAAEGHTVCVETALSDVVAGCFEAGSTMFNLGDGLHDPDVVATIARLNPAVIAAYRPTEAREPVDIRAHFQDPVVEGLAQTVDLLREAGVARIIADCGIAAAGRLFRITAAGQTGSKYCNCQHSNSQFPDFHAHSPLLCFFVIFPNDYFLTIQKQFSPSQPQSCQTIRKSELKMPCPMNRSGNRASQRRLMMRPPVQQHMP